MPLISKQIFWNAAKTGYLYQDSRTSLDQNIGIPLYLWLIFGIAWVHNIGYTLGEHKHVLYEHVWAMLGQRSNIFMQSLDQN